MDIVLQNVGKGQLTLIRELAIVLGLQMEERNSAPDTNAVEIRAAINRVESGSADLHTLGWDEFRKLAYGK